MGHIKITYSFVSIHCILTNEKTKINLKKKKKKCVGVDLLTRAAEEDRIDRELMQGQESHLF